MVNEGLLPECPLYILSGGSRRNTEEVIRARPSRLGVVVGGLTHADPMVGEHKEHCGMKIYICSKLGIDAGISAG